jgi:crotonobetainyl-CoA:carnitine CoA-transferase CaiB-like acyl-CoA transferase
MDEARETAGAGPMAGYRVVELAVWVAGPAAAGLLCDWGADVVKVEPPAGDPQRNIFGALGLKVAAAPPFEIDNRGKRSVVLDLRTPDGLAAMDRLLAGADVFVTNLRPDALERLGLDHETICARYPTLVYASLTGYGLQGPDRDRPGYDVGAFWARSGMASTIVPPGQLPPGIRSGMGDHVTGITLAAGFSPGCSSARKRAEGVWWPRRSCAPACTASGGTSGSCCASGASSGPAPAP